ncbi:MAG: ATP-binding protein [Lachnospiraceae bacterium]
MKKHSLRNQIAGVFVATMFLTLVIINVINAFFLEPYYVSQKISVLEKTYSTLSDFSDKDEKAIAKIKSYSVENNLTWVVSDIKAGVKHTYGRTDNTNRMESIIDFYTIMGAIPENTIVKKTDDYIIQKSMDPVDSTEYVEMFGVYSDGNISMVRSPLESIRESVDTANLFYFYVGIPIILAATVLIWIITRKILKPISELSEISQKMARLDFDTKYQPHGKSEIDILGENFNSMSSQLENTITQLKSVNLQLQKDIEQKTEIENIRTEFLDSVSHELKTPISLIQGYAEGLKDNINDDEESKEFYCEVIIDEAAKMNTMVKKLLSLNQLESGYDAVTLERFDIVALIHDMLQSSSLLFQQKEINVIFTETEPVHVWADEFKIEEVLTNYLTNALNHVDEQKIIEIKIEHHDNGVRVSVFNSGLPIPKEDITQIWNKFYKVDKARTREYGGSGIGLSIVKAIMESMQQKCGVENYDNGVLFWFDLSFE